VNCLYYWAVNCTDHKFFHDCANNFGFFPYKFYTVSGNIVLYVIHGVGTMFAKSCVLVCVGITCVMCCVFSVEKYVCFA
jgi:hypothetical protein